MAFVTRLETFTGYELRVYWMRVGAGWVEHYEDKADIPPDEFIKIWDAIKDIPSWECVFIGDTEAHYPCQDGNETLEELRRSMFRSHQTSSDVSIDDGVMYITYTDHFLVGDRVSWREVLIPTCIPAYQDIPF